MTEKISYYKDMIDIFTKYPDGHLPDLIISCKVKAPFSHELRLKSIKSITFDDSLCDDSCEFMFSGCFNLETVPLFDTSHITTMAGMFYTCTSLQSVPLFNTQRVINMNGMFNNCHSLEYIPEFNVSPFIKMDSIIKECRSLKKVPKFILMNELVK